MANEGTNTGASEETERMGPVDQMEQLGLPSKDDVQPTPEERQEDAQVVGGEPEAAPEPAPDAAAPEPTSEPTPDPTVEFREQLDRERQEREAERQGFLRALEETRARVRDSEARLQQAQQQPQQAPAQAPQGPLGVPVRENPQDGSFYIAEEDLARFRPPTPQAPQPDPMAAYMAQREQMRTQLINRDPVRYASPVNEFYQLYDEIDREVAARRAAYGGAPLPDLQTAMDFVEQSGAAAAFQQRHADRFPDLYSVLDFVEAGITNAPRKISRAVDGLLYARAGAAAGPAATGSPEAAPTGEAVAPSTPADPASAGATVQRLPVDRPRPMGLRGRAPEVESTGRSARYQELMGKDPFTMSDAEGDELRKLISEIEQEEEAEAMAKARG